MKKKKPLKHNKKITIIVILSLGFSFLIGTYVFNHNLVDFTKTLDSVLLFVSISVGFIGTSLSIFATVSDKKFGMKLKTSKNSKRQFINTLSTALFTGLLIVLTTIVYQLMKSNLEDCWLLTVINYVWLFLVPLFLGYGYIIVSVILTILFSDD
ncbi:hypothetical protein [Virgibacillus ainsalahensis]